MKRLLILLICIFSLGTIESCRSKGAYNPYRSARKRPSEIQMSADKKHLKKMKRVYKRQMRANRKYLFGRKTAPRA
jgi:hypothetical protein